MSCRGSGGHLFVCTAFHKQCAVNHLRWRVSASQRRVQPALNTEDSRRRSILLWLFSLIAAPLPSTPPSPCWDAAADVWYYCAAPAVPVQRLLSNYHGRVGQNWGSRKLPFVAAKWEIEKRAIMIHAPGLIYGLTGQYSTHSIRKSIFKKNAFPCCFYFNITGFTSTDVSKYLNLYFRVTLETIFSIVSCVAHLYQE